MATVVMPEISPVELTPKERLVHELLVLEGLTDGEMAQRLGMTERAVKFHVQNLLQKTAAPDRFKMAVAFWRAWSGYDEQVEDAARPVRRRDDPLTHGTRRKRTPRATTTSKRRPAAAAKKTASKKASKAPAKKTGARASKKAGKTAARARR